MRLYILALMYRKTVHVQDDVSLPVLLSQCFEKLDEFETIDRSIE